MRRVGQLCLGINVPCGHICLGIIVRGTMVPRNECPGDMQRCCHAKIGPGEKWSGRTTFRCQNWSDPGPLLVANNAPGFQKWSWYINLQETVPCLQMFMQDSFLYAAAWVSVHTHAYVYICMANMRASFLKPVTPSLNLAYTAENTGSSDMVKALKETHAINSIH